MATRLGGRVADLSSQPLHGRLPDLRQGHGPRAGSGRTAPAGAGAPGGRGGGRRRASNGPREATTGPRPLRRGRALRRRPGGAARAGARWPQAGGVAGRRHRSPRAVLSLADVPALLADAAGKGLLDVSVPAAGAPAEGLTARARAGRASFAISCGSSGRGRRGPHRALDPAAECRLAAAGGAPDAAAGAFRAGARRGRRARRAGIGLIAVLRRQADPGDSDPYVVRARYLYGLCR